LEIDFNRISLSEPFFSKREDFFRSLNYYQRMPTHHLSWQRGIVHNRSVLLSATSLKFIWCYIASLFKRLDLYRAKESF